jgi:hypothetical protein
MAAKRVLFFAPYANWHIHFQVDVFLALALKLRGAEVSILTCDSLYPGCPAIKGRQDCATCKQASEEFRKVFLVPGDPLNAVLTPIDEEAARDWVAGIAPADYPTARFEGLPIGDWALSTALTQFRTTPAGLTQEPMASAYARFMIDTLKTYWAVSRIIERDRPDHAVVFNGRFYPFRTAFEAFRAYGVPVTVHERGFVNDSFLFFDNRTVLNLGVYSDLYREWRDVALPEPVLRTLSTIFDGRKNGKDLNQYPFYNFSDRTASVRERLGIPSGKRIVGVFTSSFDELYSFDNYGLIDNQVNLLKHLFDYYRDRDVCLVVRHHPYIGGLAYDMPEQHMLCEYYRNALDAPDNVRVIMPKEKVISYDLFPHLDYAIAPYSTISVEMALDGIPVAVKAGTPQADAFPFTMGAMSRDDVFALCDRMEAEARPLDPENMRRAYRYANVQHLLFSWNLAGIGISEHFRPDIRVKTSDELLPGVDPTLDQICGHLLGEGGLYRHPGAEDRMRGLDDEDAWMTARLTALTDARRALVPASGAGAEDVGSVPSTPTLPPRLAAIHLDGPGAPLDVPVERWFARSAYPNTGAVTLPRGASSPRAVVLEALRHPEALESAYILLHAGRVQYEERTLGYAVGALLADPGKRCAAIGAWICRNDAVYGYLPSNRLGQDLARHVEPALSDPLASLSLTVWRREALLALAAGAENDEAFERSLFQTLSGSDTHHFIDAMAMLYL